MEGMWAPSNQGSTGTIPQYQPLPFTSALFLDVPGSGDRQREDPRFCLGLWGWPGAFQWEGKSHKPDISHH